MKPCVQSASFVELLRAKLAESAIIPMTKEFADSETIFQEGDGGDGLYLIEEGGVRISAVVAQAGRRILREFGPGDFFGEMAVIDDRPRSATATAVGRCRLSFVSSDAVMKLMERSPQLAIVMLRAFSQRVRDFNQRFVQEMLEADRLATFGRFARSIVHDIKNPLYVISLAGDLVGMESVSLETRRGAGRRIYDQVDRVTGMLNEMLRMTRGNMQQQPLVATDFAAYFNALCESARDQLAAREVTFLMEAPPPAVQVKINARRLDHAFGNIFNNAADVMKDGGQIILRYVQNGNELVTEIEDTGPGFEDGVAANLFTPFFTQGKANGTGLGLSICKNIIEDHGGRVWARDERGRGAIFCIGLPLGE